MPSQALTRDQLLDLLSAGPAQTAAHLSGFTPQQLRTRPAPEAWSAVEVLAHLRACADVWGDYIHKIAAGEPAFRAISPRTWAKRADYTELEFEPSFQAFRAQREELLAFLESLPDDVWSRTAAVTKDGRTRPRSLRSYLELLANHEQEHVAQIEGIARVD